MSIYEISAATTIAVPPEHVWAVLDDVRGWPRWMPSTRNLAIDLLTPGQPRQGYQFRLRGKVAQAVMEVTTFAPLERTTSFQLNVPPLKGTNSCRLFPLEDGRYRLKRVDRLVLPGPVMKFLDATQRDRFEKLAAEFLQTLKQAAEETKRDADNKRAAR